MHDDGSKREPAPILFYFDGGLVVFTEAYHRQRGSCCNSGCRHCPWRDNAEADPSAS